MGSPRWEVGILKNTKHATTIWPNYTPGHLVQRNAGLCWHKNLYTSVYSSFIRHIKHWKQLLWPWMGKWLNKLWSLQIMGCYLATKIKTLLIHRQPRWIVRELCWVKKKPKNASPKRSHVWFYLDNILNMSYRNGEKIRGFQGFQEVLGTEGKWI